MNEPASPPAAPLRERDTSARRTVQRRFDRPIVLEAGAGTGKTASLVARVVAWAMGPGWERSAERARATRALEHEREADVAGDALSRIVAITFTEAAAAEMAERVGKALTAVIRGQAVEGLDADVLPADAGERTARARALVGSLDRLEVRTIHAFCRRLLARHPLAAGLHPQFQVDANERTQSEVIREVVVAALRDAYDAERDGPLLRLAVRGTGPPEVQEALLALVRAGVQPEDLEHDPLAPERVARHLAALGQAAGALLELEGGRLAPLGGRTGATRDAAARTRDRVAGAVDVAALCTALAGIWSSQDLDRLRGWSNEKFGVKEKAELGADLAAFASAAGRLDACLRAWLAVDAELLEAARAGLAPLLRRANEELRRRGALTFQALLREARELLRARPEVCARERRALEQLLVDEFQDTDPLQCDVVRALALEGPSGERPGLFVVGDPKQSIYGWRSADLRAYDAFVREVEGAGGRQERLHVNFRSMPPILDEVERALRPLLRRREGVQPGFQSLVPSAQNAGAAGFAADPWAPVEYWISWQRDPATGGPAETRAAAASALEARALARDLARLHAAHGLAWGECAVLFRNTGDLEVYLAALREAGVPYTVERDRSYYQRREVIDAAALVRAILDPNDHLALLTWLRSPAVGVPDAALVPLWAQHLPRHLTELHAPDPERLGAARAAVRAAAEEVAALRGRVPGLERVDGWEDALLAAIESLAILRESFERDAPDRFVESLRSLTLVEPTEAARYLGRFRAGNLERFFRELAEELAEHGDPQALLRRLRASVGLGLEEEERPPPSSEDAVRVMTIHKAKGLTFGHVYVVQCHKLRGGPTRPLPAVTGWVDGQLEYRLFGAATPGFGELREEREEVDAAEAVRALYVAATRPKQRLVLMGTWSTKSLDAPPEPEGARSFADLLAQRAVRAGDPRAAMGAAAAAGRSWIDADGARWRFLSLEPDARPPRGARRGAVGLPGLGELERAVLRIEARRDAAQARMRRPWRGAASDEAHPEARESAAARRWPGDAGDGETPGHGEGARPAALDVAAAAGTAVHRVLEALDLGTDLGAELARGRARLAELLAGEVAPAALEQVRARAEQTLERFAAGPLCARLRRIAPHVIARELPVWLPAEPGGAGAVGCVAGAIDLLYRDPASGELVVADWKTDRIETDAEIAERRERYAGQGALYARAVQEALQLERPPRFELWLLHAGRVE